MAANAFQPLVAQANGVQLCSGTPVVALAARAEERAPSTGGEETAGSSGPPLGHALSLAPVVLRARGEEEGAAEDSSGTEPRQLWEWRSEAAQELPVSCVAWNKVGRVGRVGWES